MIVFVPADAIPAGARVVIDPDRIEAAIARFAALEATLAIADDAEFHAALGNFAPGEVATKRVELQQLVDTYGPAPERPTPVVLRGRGA